MSSACPDAERPRSIERLVQEWGLPLNAIGMSNSVKCLGSNNNEQMTPAQHYELSLVQADGDFRLETSPHQLGDSTDLYGEANKRFADPTSPSSKWWDGTASNLDIFEVTAPGDMVRFRTKLSEDGSGIIRVRKPK